MSSFGAGRIGAANRSFKAFFNQELHILFQALCAEDTLALRDGGHLLQGELSKAQLTRHQWVCGQFPCGTIPRRGHLHRYRAGFLGKRRVDSGTAGMLKMSSRSGLTKGVQEGGQAAEEEGIRQAVMPMFNTVSLKQRRGN